MSKKSWHLNRRTLLKGTAVVCGLPYLEAMSSEKQKSSPAKRMCFVYFPNGVSNPSEKNEADIPYRWFPRGEGKSYQNNFALEPLERHRSEMSILGGLSHPRSRKLLGHIAGDTWLTGGDLRTTYNNNISVDQVAARHMIKETPYPYFAFSADGGVGYKSRVCTLSFNAQGNPVPSEHQHRQIFERYFSRDGSTSSEVRRQQIHQGKKIVDLVLESSKDLKRRLGKHDQEKIDQHLSSLNTVEQQLQRNEAWLDVPLKKVDTSHLNFDLDPAKNAETYIRTMYDLIVLAYQMDLSRTVTYMVAREDGMGYGENFPQLAINSPKGHHGISHSNDPKLWATYDNWLSQQFSYFLDQMKQVKDAQGSILDSTQILYGSSQSTTHNAINLPLILAGGKNMGIKHGTYTKFTDKTPMSNLFVSMLNAAGIQRSKFSDSTGPLPGTIFS